VRKKSAKSRGESEESPRGFIRSGRGKDSISPSEGKASFLKRGGLQGMKGGELRKPRGPVWDLRASGCEGWGTPSDTKKSSACHNIPRAVGIARSRENRGKACPEKLCQLGKDPLFFRTFQGTGGLK